MFSHQIRNKVSQFRVTRGTVSVQIRATWTRSDSAVDLAILADKPGQVRVSSQHGWHVIASPTGWFRVRAVHPARSGSGGFTLPKLEIDAERSWVIRSTPVETESVPVPV